MMSHPKHLLAVTVRLGWQKLKMSMKVFFMGQTATEEDLQIWTTVGTKPPLPYHNLDQGAYVLHQAWRQQ